MPRGIQRDTLGLTLSNSFGEIGADMGFKFFVALQLEVMHHFIERCAGGQARRFEPPSTFGATETSKAFLVNPYQLPAHGHLCPCARPSTRLLSGNETFWFATN